jgi:hypothetical protein
MQMSSFRCYTLNPTGSADACAMRTEAEFLCTSIPGSGACFLTLKSTSLSSFRGHTLNPLSSNRGDPVSADACAMRTEAEFLSTSIPARAQRTFGSGVARHFGSGVFSHYIQNLVIPSAQSLIAYFNNILQSRR